MGPEGVSDIGYGSATAVVFEDHELAVRALIALAEAGVAVRARPGGEYGAWYVERTSDERHS